MGEGVIIKGNLHVPIVRPGEYLHRNNPGYPLWEGQLWNSMLHLVCQNIIYRIIAYSTCLYQIIKYTSSAILIVSTMNFDTILIV